VAVIGLGTGSLACHRRDGERWSYFEIDPEVVRVARDPKLFRFMSACDPRADIVPGDARLTLAAAPQAFDLIVLDAFSSDAIPAHLLTREAFAAYRSKLTGRGVIVAHVSNRHMELAQVVAAVGAAEGLVMAVKQDTAANASGLTLAANSLVVVLARHESDLDDLLQRPGWRRIGRARLDRRFFRRARRDPAQEIRRLSVRLSSRPQARQASPALQGPNARAPCVARSPRNAFRDASAAHRARRRRNAQAQPAFPSCRRPVPRSR
jgi:hypothetical protein